ncbi:MAG: site-specific integrase [Candidatus Gastranaerophilales bacterium]|nr:site-specific integrase [Candidatus Gastranaerophilales bacterium]
MSVFKHKNGYYGYNFMYKGQRYCRTFKGLGSDEIAKLETIHKAELIKTGYDITKKQVYNLSELITDYKEHRKAHYTRPDEFDYVIDEFYKLVGNKDVEQITVSDLEKYINSRLGKIKNSSINREVDNIRRIFSLAVENKRISVNPCSALKKLRIENPPERYLTKEEETKLLAACNPIMKAIIITALHTGMRQNKILSLKWQDVFFEEDYLIALNTKNNKSRKLPLTTTLKTELQKLPKLSEYVFTSRVTGTRYTDVKTSFKRAVERSGIAYITFHQLRHTTASRLNEAGVDIVTIQKILDHADLKTTLRYTHNSSASITNAFEVLDKY